MQTKSRNASHRGTDLVEQAQETADGVADLARATGNAAWERATGLYENAQQKVVGGARYADRAIREKPYHAVGIAFGVGLLLGVLWKKKQS
jgi:ElaB/YqjD/DUF883 family membrane-anchored ribosome-binding protein